MNSTMIAFQRKLFFNFLCEIRMKEPNEYLTPLELATFRQIQSGVEYILDEYDYNTKLLVDNEE